MNKHNHTPHGFRHRPEGERDGFGRAPGPMDAPRSKHRDGWPAEAFGPGPAGEFLPGRRGPGPFDARHRGGTEEHDPAHAHGRRGRRRGDVRIAVLLLLSEESMHGYQLMQTITERTDGAWSPSPGAIYPTLSQLEDEGLVRVDTSGGRKEASLTEAGQAHVEEHRSTWPNPLAAENGPRLRELMHSLSEAVRQVGRTGNDAQRQQAAKELTDVRRRIYLILAGDEQSSTGQE